MSKHNMHKKNSTARIDFHVLPERMIFFLICLIPVFSIIAFGGVSVWAMGVNTLFTGSILLLWLLDSWQKNAFQISRNPLQIPLLGLIFIGLFQLLPIGSSGDLSRILPVSGFIPLSNDPYATRFAVINLLNCLIFFGAALTYVNTRQRLKILVYLLFLTGAVMAFIGILQRVGGVEAIYGIRFVRQENFFASFVNPHHFAALMLMTIGLGLGLLFVKTQKREYKIFPLFGLIIMVLALVFPGSRAGFFILFAVAGFVFIYQFFNQRNEMPLTGEEEGPKGIKIPVYIISGVVLLVLLFGSVVFLGGDKSLLRGANLSAGAGDFSSGRLHFWGVALKNFADHPIIGAGLDSYGVIYSKYDTWNGMYRVEQAHSDYLQILSDAGILGFLCIAGFIFLLIKKWKEKVKLKASDFSRQIVIGAFAGCVGILIHSAVDFPLRTPANAFVFLLLVVISTESFHKKRSVSTGLSKVSP